MSGSEDRSGTNGPSSVRDRILTTASELFYRNAVRAVGIDWIVKESRIAKTSLYRHFQTKDALVAAFLEAEDRDFWRQWDSVHSRHRDDAGAELAAHIEWMGARLRRPGYRGCPQLNVAAEFADPQHPARLVARAHKSEMRQRLVSIAERLGFVRAEEVGAQLALVVDGAFMSATHGDGECTAATFRGTVEALLVAARA